MLLNVLLLEDNPAKKSRLLTFLNSKRNDLFQSVDTALSVADAIASLKAHKYDLLISDIVVPPVLGGEAHEQYSIELFQQIDEAVGVQPPRYAVAISSSNELSALAYDAFVGRPWGILRYSETNDEWLTTIEKICRYILSKEKHDLLSRNCDIFVITALERPEFTSLESTDIKWSPFEPLDRTQLIKYGEIEINGEIKIVGAAFAPRMGPVASAVLTAKAILKLQPKIVIMCGVCAGVPSKASVGDVIAADVAWDWQSGKYVDKNDNEHFEARPHQISIDEEIRNQLILLKRDEAFWNSLAPLAIAAKQKKPGLILGPMATGASVLSDSRVTDRIKSTQHSNLTGLDMEVYGVYAAASSCDPEIRFIALKAVCDKGDKKKDEKYQPYASKVAAEAVFHFIKKFSGSLLK